MSGEDLGHLGVRNQIRGTHSSVSSHTSSEESSKEESAPLEFWEAVNVYQLMDGAVFLCFQIVCVHFLYMRRQFVGIRKGSVP